jgi:hypothetical protein
MDLPMGKAGDDITTPRRRTLEVPTQQAPLRPENDVDMDEVDARVAGIRRRRKQQLKVLVRFVKKQRRAQKWFNFDSIAGEYAKRRGSGDIYEQLREEAYADLILAYLRDDFEGGKGSRVMYFDEALATNIDSDVGTQRFVRRLTIDDLKSYLAIYNSDLRIVTDGILRHCWMPRDCCRVWLEARGMKMPRYWLPAGKPRPDWLTKLIAWLEDWKRDHPKASVDNETFRAAKDQFPKERRITRKIIRTLCKPPDGASRVRGRKPGKSESEFH